MVVFFFNHNLKCAFTDPLVRVGFGGCNNKEDRYFAFLVWWSCGEGVKTTVA